MTQGASLLKYVILGYESEIGWVAIMCEDFWKAIGSIVYLSNTWVRSSLSQELSRACREASRSDAHRLDPMGSRSGRHSTSAFGAVQAWLLMACHAEPERRSVVEAAGVEPVSKSMIYSDTQ